VESLGAANRCGKRLNAAAADPAGGLGRATGAPSLRPFAVGRKSQQPSQELDRQATAVTQLLRGLLQRNSTSPKRARPVLEELDRNERRSDSARALATRLLEIAVLPGGQSDPCHSKLARPIPLAAEAELPGPLAAPRPAAPIPRRGGGPCFNWARDQHSSSPGPCIWPVWCLDCSRRWIAWRGNNPTLCPPCSAPARRWIDVISA